MTKASPVAAMGVLVLLPWGDSVCTGASADRRTNRQDLWPRGLWDSVSLGSGLAPYRRRAIFPLLTAVIKGIYGFRAVGGGHP